MRQTPLRYLKALVELGLLREVDIGKESRLFTRG
ncbi:hypothetical protein [Fluviicoccus sp.]